MAATVDTAIAGIREIQCKVPGGRRNDPSAVAMIVLRSPKGWTGPKEVDGKQTEGSGAHTRCRFSDMGQTGTRALAGKLDAVYRPEELFDANGTAQA